MKNSYQFSFNPSPNQREDQEIIGITTLFKDLFPYLSMKSITFALLNLQLLWLILSFGELTIIPENNQQIKQRNLFVQLASNLASLIIVGRVGSEYEAKLGNRHYLSVIIIIQILRIFLVFIMNFQSASLIVVNNSSILSLYVLSMINIQKWKQNQIPEYQTNKKIVENCDLLDLNDTVIKLRPNQSQFIYESYTNREFYFHNIAYKDEKNAKNMTKQGKKVKKSVKYIKQLGSERQEQQLKILKLFLWHYIAYQSYRYQQLIILMITEVAIFMTLNTKILSKIQRLLKM